MEEMRRSQEASPEPKPWPELSMDLSIRKSCFGWSLFCSDKNPTLFPGGGNYYGILAPRRHANPKTEKGKKKGKKEKKKKRKKEKKKELLRMTTKQKEEKKRWKVVVVGAGPVGMTAALVLVRHGVDPSEIRIVDQSPAHVDIAKVIIILLLLLFK